MMNVIGFHIIMCFYGFWLPNDERGSGSDWVRNKSLLKYGPANPVDGSRSVAGKRFDPAIRKLARSELLYPHVEINGPQALSVAKGFRNEITQYGGAIHALAILPSHSHLVIPPPRYDVVRFAGRLKGAATRQLKEDGSHPLAKYRDRRGQIPSPWARLPWVVYLFTDADIDRSIKYVENNPLRDGKPPQHWNFVTPWH
jgi:REP element-mobilizing transposase RayT